MRLQIQMQAVFAGQLARFLPILPHPPLFQPLQPWRPHTRS